MGVFGFRVSGVWGFRVQAFAVQGCCLFRNWGTRSRVEGLSRLPEPLQGTLSRALVCALVGMLGIGLLKGSWTLVSKVISKLYLG